MKVLMTRMLLTLMKTVLWLAQDTILTLLLLRTCQSGTYPNDADKKQKNSLRKRAKFFVVLHVGGKLHYIGGHGKKTLKPPVPRMVIEFKKEQIRLIQIVHDQGHLGRDKTMCQLTECYYWPDMYKQTCDYVSFIAWSQ